MTIITSTRRLIISFNSCVICSIVSFSLSTVACSSTVNWETRSLPTSDCNDSSLAQNWSMVAIRVFN
jgi:hypothetical protein